MRKIITLLIIVSVFWGYLVPADSVGKVPQGPEIRMFIRNIGDPIKATVEDVLAGYFPRIADFMIVTLQNIAEQAFNTLRDNTREGLRVKEGFQNNLDDEQKQKINEGVDEGVESILR